MKAIALKYYQKALGFKAKGNFLKAIDSYKLALRNYPDFVEALSNLGSILNDLKRPDEALKFLDKANKLRPNNNIVLNNIGVSKMQLGLNSEAIDIFQNVLTQYPQDIKAHLNIIKLTVNKLEQFQYDSRKKKLNHLIQNGILVDLFAINELKNSSLPLFHFLESEIIQYIDQSVNQNISPKFIYRSLTSCSEIKPLVTLLKIAQRNARTTFIKSFINSYDSELNKTPGYYLIKARFLLTNELGSINEIKSLLSKAKTQRQDREEILSIECDLAYWTGDFKKLGEKCNFLEKLNSCVFPSSRTWSLLQNHEFTRGWNIYNNRKQLLLKNIEPALSKKINSHKRITIYCDQGIGDQVMFLQLLNKAIVDIDPEKTTIKCDERLIPSIKRSFPQFNNIVGLRENNVTSDLTVTLSSLAERYIFSLKDFNSPPYLKADPELMSYWANKLSSLDGTLKVGFAWQGGIKQFSRFQASKSMGLDVLETLFDMKNTSWVNLQYGNVSDELENLIQRQPNVTFYDEIDPYVEVENQFALISNLDILIQPSNASIHFAGALGIKSWVLLGCPHDFRWFSNGIDEQSAWYPSVRMIKKEPKQSWQELVDLLVPELAALAANKS